MIKTFFTAYTAQYLRTRRTVTMHNQKFLSGRGDDFQKIFIARVYNNN